jgi:hypothetical protein
VRPGTARSAASTARTARTLVNRRGAVIGTSRYQPTATSRYCGSPWDTNEDWSA